MTASLPPGWIVLVGAFFLPFLPGRARPWAAVVLPALSLAHLLALPLGTTSEPLAFLGFELTLVRIDALSRLFGIVFHLAAFLSALYALHVRDGWQQVGGLVYAGSAIAALYAADLVTLFLYWELTAISSVFLIWARRSERSQGAGLRYLVIQVGSGLLLMAGLILHHRATGSIAFERLIAADGTLAASGPGVLLIFLAFGVKCAFPFLHNWLQDAYPEATVTGTVFLSAFTTKLAVYALARAFPGTGVLVEIGVAMTLFPIFYAVIENDLRRVLAYSLNNQLGFMVTGIGIGTELSLNGTAAHAFCHILYKALLFMSMGAVLYRAKTIKASELGGLWRSMPITAVCCLIGAASISAFPLLSGFVSKSLILTAAAEGHLVWPWVLLVVASAGVMEHSGIKIPYFSFFGHDSGIRCREAPPHMLVAMILTAAACVLLGVLPDLLLYPLLPFPLDYEPYTASHVLSQLQLLLFAALAFAVLLRTGLYPAEQRSVNLDFDWVYRKVLPATVGGLRRAWGWVSARLVALARRALVLEGVLVRLAGPEGFFARTWTTGRIALAAAVMLGVYLVVYFW